MNLVKVCSNSKCQTVRGSSNWFPKPLDFDSAPHRAPAHIWSHAHNVPSPPPSAPQDFSSPSGRPGVWNPVGPDSFFLPSCWLWNSALAVKRGGGVGVKGWGVEGKVSPEPAGLPKKVASSSLPPFPVLIFPFLSKTPGDRPRSRRVTQSDAE